MPTEFNNGAGDRHRPEAYNTDRPASPARVEPASRQGVIGHFVLHPFRLIIRNSSVLLVFFVVIAFNFVTQQSSAQPITQLGQWAFETLPNVIGDVLWSPAILAGVLMLFLAKTVLGVVVAQEMLLLYQGERRGIVDSLRRVSMFNIWWFVGAELAIYAVFGAIALSFYLPAYWIWHAHRIDLTIALLILFALLYPAFYICLSTTSMVTVMPLSSRKRIEKLRYLVTTAGAVKMWLFYTIRLTVEAVLLFVVPFFAISVLKNYLLASLSAGVGLMVPFALLRGSSYELKLDLFKGDPEIEAMFKTHYAELKKSTRL